MTVANLIAKLQSIIEIEPSYADSTVFVEYWIGRELEEPSSLHEAVDTVFVEPDYSNRAGSVTITNWLSPISE